jgi:hypothetical protein
VAARAQFAADRRTGTRRAVRRPRRYTRQPDITVPVGDSEAVAEKARDFVAAANEVAGALGQAVKIALYGDRTDVGRNTTPLTTARDRFWADTNDRFFATLNDFSKLPAEELAGDAAIPMARAWRAVMERAALAIFDDMAPVQDALSPDVKRVVEGRRFLVRMLLGYGASGVKLFGQSLDLVPAGSYRCSCDRRAPSVEATAMRRRRASCADVGTPLSSVSAASSDRSNEAQQRDEAVGVFHPSCPAVPPVRCRRARPPVPADQVVRLHPSTTIYVLEWIDSK